MQKILLLIKTLRHLKLIQICYQIRYKIKFIQNYRKNLVKFREYSHHFDWFSSDIESTTDGKIFTFIGKTYEINTDWNPKNIPKLWLYNLHYHDILNSQKTIFSDEQCEELINNWIKYNPPFHGNGWEPYCLSLRIVNWVKYLSSRDSNDCPASLLYSLAEQSNALYWQIEYHIQGNHLFSNAKALIFSGSLICGKNSNNWYKLGVKILSRELSEQFLNDGAHYERSPMYHSLLLWDLLDLYQLSQFSNLNKLAELTDLLESKIVRGIEWLENICHPDGNIAFFNDSAFEVAPKLQAIKNYADHLSVPYFSEKFTERHHDWHFHNSKLSGFIMVSKNSPTGQHKAFINVAPIEPTYQPGHAHADTLSFELSLYNKRVFVNSGTSDYQHGELRQYQRSTSAHNTVSIEGKNSSEVWSSFRVAKRAQILSTNISHESNYLIVDASHDGFSKFNQRIIHHRQWSFGESIIHIQDRLEGRFNLATLFFYLHPDITVTECEDKIILNIDEGQKATCHIASKGRLSVHHSYWYPEFGKSIPNLCLKMETSEKIIDTKIIWE